MKTTRTFTWLMIVILSTCMVRSAAANTDTKPNDKSRVESLATIHFYDKRDTTKAQRYFIIGYRLLVAQHYDSSLLFNERAIAEDSSMAAAYNNKAVALVRLHQHLRALPELDRAIALDRTMKEAYLNRGIALYRLKRYQEAIASIDTSIALEPLAKSYWARGMCYIDINDLEKGSVDFGLSLSMDSTCSLPYVGFAYIDYQRQKYEASKANCNKALKLDSTLGLGYFYRGKCAAIQKKYQAAIADFDRALKFDSTLYNVYYYRSRACIEAQQYDKAIADIQIRIAQDSTDYTAYLDRGLVKAYLKENKSALADYDHSIALFGDSAISYLDRAALKINALGDMEGGARDVATALRIDSTHGLAHALLGHLYALSKNYPKALSEYEVSLKYQPQGNFEALGGRGYVKHLQKDNVGALPDLDRAIAIYPQHMNAYLNRGVVKMQLKDYQGAVKDFDVALRQDPARADTYLGRGMAKSMLKDHKGAIEDFNTGLKLAPSNANLYFYRAFDEYYLGKNDAACGDMEMARKLGAPGTEESIKLLCNK